MTASQEADGVSHGIWLRNRDSVDVGRVVDAAVLAAESGWDGVFLSDSLWEGWTHPWTLHAAIAAWTERIRLEAWITPIPSQQPWQLASELATLDRLSDGRVNCGGGLGVPQEYETYGGDYEPGELGQRDVETLDIIQGLWAEDPFSYDGEHYTVDEASLSFGPSRSRASRSCWRAGGRTRSRSTAGPGGTASRRRGRRT